MNRKQAFSELIKRRNWYAGLNISSKTATTHKKRFLEGKNVSEEFMARALNAAGYKLQQEEIWSTIEKNTFCQHRSIVSFNGKDFFCGECKEIMSIDILKTLENK